ncbi:MAG TPA: hypothetical protein VFY17_09610 [Pilimelia sp.]|nr:hypothetical protein [Pilimelia sp.]
MRDTLKHLVAGLAAVVAGALLWSTPAAAGTGPTATEVAGAAAAERVSATIPLYRLYSAAQTDHFYTTSWEEATNAFNNLGYTYEGVAGKVLPSAGPGTVPLHRLYHGGAGDHFYTTNWNEAVNAFNNLGYTYEGVQAHVDPA